MEFDVVEAVKVSAITVLNLSDVSDLGYTIHVGFGYLVTSVYLT